MEYFGFLLCAMGLSNSMFFDGWNPDFDLIGALPLEISTTILRLLDSKTLLTAALVCKKWMRIIKSDRVLRQKIRDEFRARRMVSIYHRTDTGESNRTLFGRMTTNVNVRMERRAVEVVVPRSAVTGKKRKFQHEVVLTDKRRKSVVPEKKTVAETPRLLTRLR